MWGTLALFQHGFRLLILSSSERIVTTDNKLEYLEANFLSGSKVLTSKKNHIEEIRF